MKDESEDYDAIKDAMNTNDMAEASFWFSEWLGAIFFYMVNFGKTPFEELSKADYRTRNVWVGWLLKMVFVFGGLFLLLIIME